MRFVPLPGQRHDTIGVPPLIEGVAFGALLGDKAFDVDWLRADLDARGAVAVIPPKAGRKTLVACDRAMYRWRHLIENTFAKLKAFRAVATRYDKAEGNSRANIKLAATIIASRWTSTDPRPSEIAAAAPNPVQDRAPLMRHRDPWLTPTRRPARE